MFFAILTENKSFSTIDNFQCFINWNGLSCNLNEVFAILPENCSFSTSNVHCYMHWNSL